MGDESTSDRPGHSTSIESGSAPGQTEFPLHQSLALSTRGHATMTHQDVLCYDAPFNLYGISFSSSTLHPNRVALTSFQSTSTNKLQVLDVPSSSTSASSSNNDFQVLATANLTFPPTRVGFEPSPGTLRGQGSDGSGNAHDAQKELMATAGDVLRVWEMAEEKSGGGGHGMEGLEFDDRRHGRGGYVGDGGGWGQNEGAPRYELRERSKLSNSKSSPANLPPLTSFSWNPHNPKSIVTCSIDTTATVWDISTSSAITQLIAHDREVYDISWLPASSDVFVSVGADGSLRAFDLRSLEHSTILFETDDHRPLARVGFSGKEQHYLCTFGVGDETAIVLDMRSPGKPVLELGGHKGALGAVAWGGESRAGPGGGGFVATCSDDAQLLVYDLTQPLPYPMAASESKSRSNTAVPNAKSNGPSQSSSTEPLTDPDRSAATSRSSTANSAASAKTTVRQPSLAWNSSYGEINNLAWGREHSAAKGSGERDGCWIGSVSGKRLTCLRF